MKTSINLFDHSKKLYVKIIRSTSGWDKYVSKSKRKWTLTDSFKTMEDALKQKEEVINNNYLSLFKLITKK